VLHCIVLAPPGRVPAVDWGVLQMGYHRRLLLVIIVLLSRAWVVWCAVL
jgi:hypothetical protein